MEEYGRRFNSCNTNTIIKKKKQEERKTQKDGKRKEKIEKTLTETIFPPDERRRRRESFFSLLSSLIIFYPSFSFLIHFIPGKYCYFSFNIRIFLFLSRILHFFSHFFFWFNRRNISSQCSFLTWDFLKQVTNSPHACMHAYLC